MRWWLFIGRRVENYDIQRQLIKPARNSILSKSEKPVSFAVPTGFRQHFGGADDEAGGTSLRQGANGDPRAFSKIRR